MKGYIFNFYLILYTTNVELFHRVFVFIQKLCCCCKMPIWIYQIGGQIPNCGSINCGSAGNFHPMDFRWVEDRLGILFAHNFETIWKKVNVQILYYFLQWPATKKVPHNPFFENDCNHEFVFNGKSFLNTDPLPILLILMFWYVTSDIQQCMPHYYIEKF